MSCVRRRVRAAAIPALLLLATAVAAETALSGRLLGGRLLADGRGGSFSGRASGAAASALPLGERWTLFPTAEASWSGVESALDVPGGTTLFQESVDGRFQLKGVYQPPASRWRLKPWLGWRGELLKETNDEAWFHGLFDHHTVDVGVEGERAGRDGGAVSLSYAFSRTLFPNFSSLESSAPLDPLGRPLARELAGTRVLDFDAQLVAAAARVPLPRGLEASGRLAFQRRDYYEQHLVGADGLLGAGTRGDDVTVLETGLRAGGQTESGLRLGGGLSLRFEDCVSDQASFEPARGVYEPRGYNETAWTLAPSARLSYGDPAAPATLSLEGSATSRRWPHRSARDGLGVYTGAPLSQSTLAVSAEGHWPLAPGLSLVGRVERVWARANDDYEAYYRYNYGVTTFLAGVALER